MKLAVITQEFFFENEAKIINQLFCAGLLLLHIRKPHCTQTELENLLKNIPEQYYNRIVLHDHFPLVEKYGLKGVHLNSRNKDFCVKGYSISKSCHSIDELKEFNSKCDYLFLSPIFNSISKKGYHSYFTVHDLINAKNEGIINNQVFALGGIDIGNIPIVKEYGFGGVAVLGALWNAENITSKFEELKAML